MRRIRIGKVEYLTGEPPRLQLVRMRKETERYRWREAIDVLCVFGVFAFMGFTAVTVCVALTWLLG